MTRHPTQNDTLITEALLVYNNALHYYSENKKIILQPQYWKI